MIIMVYKWALEVGSEGANVASVECSLGVMQRDRVGSPKSSCIWT